jgi:hypothetical protein
VFQSMAQPATLCAAASTATISLAMKIPDTALIVWAAIAEPGASAG